VDLSPLYISVRTASLATLIAFITGTVAAYSVVNLNKYLKGILDGLFTLPMILPPTVCGYFLLKLFGVRGIIGKPLLELYNIKIVFSFTATVIAASVVAFPLMYRTARGAFEQLDRTIVYSAQTLGLNNLYIFLRIIMPNCRKGILAGCVLSFARALGEFGATIMLAGNLPGKTQTISTAVYSAMAAGNNELAYDWVMVNLAISFASMLLLNIWSEKSRSAA
jgi:molybdate ABC transporter, permease protein